MELQPIRAEDVVRKAELGKEGGREETLVGKVVYREDRRRPWSGTSG